jgi:predicted DCC family thiol-disulfide oxidoreductase YuxK
VPGTLVYDGDCGFCTRSARWARSLGCAVDIAPWQEFDLTAAGLTAEEADARVQLVLGTTSYSGHEAIGEALRTSRHWPVRALGRLVLVRALRPLASRTYNWVAAHRHRLPGGSPQCVLPAEDGPAND